MAAAPRPPACTTGRGTAALARGRSWRVSLERHCCGFGGRRLTDATGRADPSVHHRRVGGEERDRRRDVAAVERLDVPARPSTARPTPPRWWPGGTYTLPSAVSRYAALP